MCRKERRYKDVHEMEHWLGNMETVSKVFEFCVKQIIEKDKFEENYRIERNEQKKRL